MVGLKCGLELTLTYVQRFMGMGEIQSKKLVMEGKMLYTTDLNEIISIIIMLLLYILVYGYM